MAKQISVLLDDRSGYTRLPQETAKRFQKQARAGTVEEFSAEAENFRDSLDRFGQAFANRINLHSKVPKYLPVIFELAANKDLAQAKRKAGLDPDDGSKTTDYVRGWQLIRQPRQATVIREMLQPETAEAPITMIIVNVKNNPLAIQATDPSTLPRGTETFTFLSLENSFTSPMANGLRRMMFKIEIKDTKGNTHVGEMQVRVKDMQKEEDRSHRLYEAQRLLEKEAKNTGDSALHGFFTKAAQEIKEVIKHIHDAAANQQGYDALITEKGYRSSLKINAALEHKILGRFAVKASDTAHNDNTPAKTTITPPATKPLVDGVEAAIN